MWLAQNNLAAGLSAHKQRLQFSTSTVAFQQYLKTVFLNESFKWTNCLQLLYCEWLNRFVKKNKKTDVIFIGKLYRFQQQQQQILFKG